MIILFRVVIYHNELNKNDSCIIIMKTRRYDSAFLSVNGFEKDMFNNLMNENFNHKLRVYVLAVFSCISILCIKTAYFGYHNENIDKVNSFPKDPLVNAEPTIDFKKIESPTCILYLDGSLTEVTGECEDEVSKEEEPISLNPMVVQPDNVKYYSKKYDRVKPDINVMMEISKSYGLPETALFYQMMIESGGRVSAKKNHAGAKGYFQFLDATAIEFGLIVGKTDYRTNPYASADAAARYLLWIGQLLYGEDADLSDIDILTHALAAYNAGHRRVSVNGSLRIPRFYETIRYTQNIIDLIEGNATLIMPNETLDAISERTGFSVGVLLQSNFGINSDKDLKAFEVMQLPKDGVSKVIVKRGMSLSLIENKTGVKVAQLKQFNNLSSDTIMPNDIIMLPTSLYVKR